MLSKDQLKQLRNEIVLNSIHLNDYSNSLGVRKQSACNFFDGYIQYLYDIKDEKNGFNLWYVEDVIKELDNIENLYNYYMLFENDPLLTMDDELLELVQNYCKDNVIDIYTDYRDFENIEGLLYSVKNINGYKSKEKITSKDQFIENIYDAYSESELYYMDDFIKYFINSINDDELKDYIETETGYDTLKDYLYYYVTINYPFDDFLDQNIKVNIFCFSEKNYSGMDDIFLKHLMHSQNYLIKDYPYIKIMLNNLNGYNCSIYKGIGKKMQKRIVKDRSKSVFINSLITEIENCYSNLPRDLCFIASVSINDYFKLLEKDKLITIKKDAICGLVDKYNGGGSVLEIELEKDITINTNNIEVLIEGVDRYTVDQIYGLVSSCYKDSVILRGDK